jgi:hypothetical protein
MKLEIREYRENDFETWNNFLTNTFQGTFLHSRNFLSYHGDRFNDKSLLIDLNGQCAALFPAAISPDDPTVVISHPGITYGGLLHDRRLRGEELYLALSHVMEFYREAGFRRLIYKAVPHIYHQIPAQDDLYALFRLDACRYRCDLSSTIDLNNRLMLNERRRRSLKKAQKANLQIVEGSQYLDSLWSVLEINLMKQHGVQPVHSLYEISLLAKRFPANISIVCAIYGEEVVAGVILFDSSNVVHLQYIASNSIGRQTCALDLIFAHTISNAIVNGRRWLDFGINNENQGVYLNKSLYNFKNEFGGGGIAYEFYEMKITS